MSTAPTSFFIHTSGKHRMAQLAETLRELDGELEGFSHSIDGGHGPGFVEKVLKERNLETDSELADARRFVTNILTRARRDSNEGITARKGDANGTT